VRSESGKDRPQVLELARVTSRLSRTYKLKLSDQGIALFLDCHSRLCRLAGDLLPYGATLRVAVTMLSEMPTAELVSEIACDELAAFMGKEVRFVGTSPSLAVLTAKLAQRAAASHAISSAPQTWLIFLAALAFMRAAEDSPILRIHNDLRRLDNRMRQPTFG
jgi:hypothetical protein